MIFSLVLVRAYQPANNIFFLITNQHQLNLLAQKPTNKQTYYVRGLHETIVYTLRAFMSCLRVVTCLVIKVDVVLT